MRKKLLQYMVFAFVVLFVFSGKVNASVKCVYGTKSDNNADWQKKFVFEVEDYNKVYINQGESPELSSYNEEESAEDKGRYFEFKYIEREYINTYQHIRLSLYGGEQLQYNKVKESCMKKNETLDAASKIPEEKCICPRALRYEYVPKGKYIWNEEYNWLLYNDELDRPELEVDWRTDKDAYQEDIMIEESYKDYKKEDLELGDCPTYTLSMEIIDSILQSEGGCTNNKYFDEEYARISEKCESLRATSTYTAEDGYPKSCQKACSNLDDEVDSMLENHCGMKKVNWYCGSLGNGIVNWIFKIIRFIRYGLPAVVIILSILDYIKALASDDDGEMKKVNKKFFTRLLAVGLLFVIPFILDFILKLFNIPGLSASNPFCAK